MTKTEELKIYEFITKNLLTIMEELNTSAGSRYKGYLFGRAKTIYQFASMLNLNDGPVQDSYDYILTKSSPGVFREIGDTAILTKILNT